MSNDSLGSELVCANCGRPLDTADKFCRDCGLPTLHQVQAQKAMPALPPDTEELKRALDVEPEPAPFLRVEPDLPDELEASGLSTGSVVQATSPTHATRMAASTVAMLILMAFFALAGLILLILAFRV